MRRPAAVCVALFVFAGAAAAEDRWTEFRGPSGTGHSDSTGLPREWSETKNVVWKTRIHGRGWSSPVVLGKQVWLTTATPEGHELSVLALDRDDGRVLFDVRVFQVARPEDTRQYNSFASPTPVIEEGRVYVHFGSYGTAALDTRTGKVLWERRDLPCNHWRGPGSSPILHGDLLIVHFDGYDVQYAVALDKKTGRTVWRADRTHDFGTDDGDQKKGYATPVVIEAAGRAQLISPAAKAVLSLDPLTGRELWRVRYPQHSAAARPLFAHGLVYVASGRGKAELLAIRPDGHGDVTGTHVAWKAFRGIGASPSPVLVGELRLLRHRQGRGRDLPRREDRRRGLAATGRAESPTRPRPSSRTARSTSLPRTDRPSRWSPAPSPGSSAAAALGEGGVMATPAIAGKAIFLRTESHLYRLERSATGPASR